MNRRCDGRLVIQERDQNNNPTANYVRGLDRSETLEGAGGIGGLLARQDGYGIVFYFSDANGNVRALVNQNQEVAARYPCHPYGALKFCGKGPIVRVPAISGG